MLLCHPCFVEMTQETFPCYHHTYARSFSSCGFTHSVYLPWTYFTRYIYMKPFPEIQETVYALFQ